MQFRGLNGEGLHYYRGQVIKLDPRLQFGWYIYPDTLMNSLLSMIKITSVSGRLRPSIGVQLA